MKNLEEEMNFVRLFLFLFIYKRGCCCIHKSITPKISMFNIESCLSKFDRDFLCLGRSEFDFLNYNGFELFRYTLKSIQKCDHVEINIFVTEPSFILKSMINLTGKFKIQIYH